MSRLITWRPFSEMNEFFKPLGPVFGNVPGMIGELRSDTPWMPAADIAEAEKEFLVKLDVPGVKPEEVQVFVADGMLHIKGERSIEKKAEGEKLHRSEVYYGAFERAFELPENVDAAMIAADCREGVLRIHLPKKAMETLKPLKIAVH